MKKIIVIIFSVIVISVSAQQQVKNYYPNGELYQVGYLDSNKKATGEWKFYYKNGLLEKAGTIKNYQAIGKWKFYDKTGHLEFTGGFNENLFSWERRMGRGKQDKDHSFSTRGKIFTFGRKTGKWKYFDKDGMLSRVTTYYDGRKDGIQKIYFKEQLIEEGKYKNGNEIGDWKSYYITGELKEKKTYISIHYLSRCSRDTNPLKMITAETKRYYKSGQLKETRTYVNGKKSNEWKSFYENGEIKEIIDYANQVYNEGRKYYKTGQLKEKKTYNLKDSIIHYQNYYKNGQLKITNYYKGNKESATYNLDRNWINGIPLSSKSLVFLPAREWKYYYDNGQLKELKKFKDGRYNGVCKSFNEKGNIVETGKYYKGNKMGVWNYYKNGKLKLSETYKIKNTKFGKRILLRRGLVRFSNNKPVYVESIIVGERKKYYDNEQLKSRLIYNKDGEKEGEAIYYYKNGKVKLTQQWKKDKLIEVTSYFDKKGASLDKGTFQNGSGILKRYDSDGLVTSTEYLYGIQIEWNKSSKLNSLAWKVYLKKDKEKLKTAIKLIKRSIELEKTYYNTDTYAALLYLKGNYKQALLLANEAIKIAKKDKNNFKTTTQLIKKINKKIIIKHK